MEEKTDNIDKKLDVVLSRLDDLETTFAAKWVERVVGGAIGLTLIAVFGALLALVVKG